MAINLIPTAATPLCLGLSRATKSKCSSATSHSKALYLGIILALSQQVACLSITTPTPTQHKQLQNSSQLAKNDILTTVSPTRGPYTQVDFLINQVNTALNIAFDPTTSTINFAKKSNNNTQATTTAVSSLTLTLTPTTISQASQRESQATTTSNTRENLIEDHSITSPLKTTTTTSISETTTLISDEFSHHDSSVRHDDDDVADCAYLSDDGEEEGKRLSNNERFIKLQNCIQGRIQKRLKASRRNGLELFESMNLSGACTASLMNLMVALGDLKSYAFKFMDASAKIPSGVMYGLLSDFGDFDQCLSIRSNADVDIEHEAEEHEFSGKYCLVNLRLNYHVDLEANKTNLDGIIADGLLWDDLIKNYWVSKSPKPFQMGMCVPSRCDHDDLSQLVSIFGKRFNSIVELQSCQDNLDLLRQHRVDLLQTIVLSLFSLISILTFAGTFLDRYRPQWIHSKRLERRQEIPMNLGGPLDKLQGRLGRRRNSISCSEFSRTSHDLGLRQLEEVELWCQLLICFSLRRNWRIFIRQNRESCGPSSESCPSPESSQEDQMRLAQVAQQSAPMQTLTSTIPGYHIELEQNIEQISENGSMKQANLETSSSFPIKPIKSASAVDLKLSLQFESSQEQKELTKSENHLIFRNSPINSSDQMNQFQQLTIKIQANDQFWAPKRGVSLSHLSGLRLLVIVWITMGMSFLYPSANNYQYYRSIINMNITRNSVWFTTTNYTLGIDMLLYMTGLVFVYKLAQVNFSNLNFASSSSNMIMMNPNGNRRIRLNSWAIFGLISKKILRFWPTYLTLIGLAICAPLLSNGPMWPEMVSKRLGEACRTNWWSNILFVNNFLKESEICLPSSWFVSVIMQLFIIGSSIIIIIHKYSMQAALFAISLLLMLSCSFSFSFAYMVDLPAPVIRMDESFVMKLNENIFQLYTNIFNNLGPFLIGMLGGLFLVQATLLETINNDKRNERKSSAQDTKSPIATTDGTKSGQTIAIIKSIWNKIPIWPMILIMTIVVLSSVLYPSYSRFWSAVYWSLHRICWAISTGYLIHQCATYKWRLLHDILSLSSFIPISRLIFITYLVFPAFIHLHSGLVRDGLHVTIYNMTNVYVTRLVMATVTALFIHLLVELPFCSVEEILLNRWFYKINKKQAQSPVGDHSLHPLLVVAPFVSIPVQATNLTPSTNLTTASSPVN